MTHAPVFDARDPRATARIGGRGGKPIGKRSTRALRIDPLPDMNLVLCSRNQRHVEAINFFGKPTNRHRHKLCVRVFFAPLEKKFLGGIFKRFFGTGNRGSVIITMELEKLCQDLIEINCLVCIVYIVLNFLIEGEEKFWVKRVIENIIENRKIIKRWN